MNELNRTRRLIIASSLFVIIIIVGLLTFSKPDFEYKLPVDAMLAEIADPQNEILPQQAREIITSEDDQFVFIDLRNSYDYNIGSIVNAINIPVSDILDDQVTDFLRQLQEDSVTLVLFGKDQREANGPWMMLKQLGFDNVKVLPGGYDFFANMSTVHIDQAGSAGYRAEDPILDFSSFMKKAGGIPPESLKEEPKTIQPVQRKKKVTSGGGC